jgi:hypothetical protein
VERAPAAHPASGDPELESLYNEVASYPDVEVRPPHGDLQPSDIVLPLRLRDVEGDGELAFFNTLSTFGSAIDITLSELAIEAFYPANARTAMRLLRQLGPLEDG